MTEIRHTPGRKKIDPPQLRAVFVKLPVELFAEVQRRAAAEDIGYSAYLRRVIKTGMDAEAGK